MVAAVLPFEYGVPAPGRWIGLCRMPAMGLESERNQSNSVLLSFVQGCRSLHPSDEDQSLGTPALMVPPQRQRPVVGDPGVVAST